MHNAIHHNFVPTCRVMDPHLRGYSNSTLLVPPSRTKAYEYSFLPSCCIAMEFTTN